MSTSGGRFEILLPLRFNERSPVPDDFIADALGELRRKFGAVSSETQRIESQGHHARLTNALRKVIEGILA